jgi:hypothetical protein
MLSTRGELRYREPDLYRVRRLRSRSARPSFGRTHGRRECSDHEHRKQRESACEM